MHSALNPRQPLRTLFLTIAALVFHAAAARAVTISNDIPRYDTSGSILPISDGNLLQHEGIFYLYGVK